VISLLRLWLNKLLHLRAAKVSVRNVIIIDDLFAENADMDSCQIQCVLKTMQPIGHLRVPVLQVYMAAISQVCRLRISFHFMREQFQMFSLHYQLL